MLPPTLPRLPDYTTSYQYDRDYTIGSAGYRYSIVLINILLLLVRTGMSVRNRWRYEPHRYRVLQQVIDTGN